MIKMILCSDVTGAIGKDNDLLFHIKEDMEFFKEMTIGHKVVMGYNTWLSLPKKPLPKRENYVLYDGEEEIEGAKVLRNINEVIELGKNEDIFIIGGAMVYNTFIHRNLLDEAFVTLVNGLHDADLFIDLEDLNRKLQRRELIKKVENSEETNIYRYYK